MRLTKLSDDPSMAKKKSWVSLVKRFFLLETHSKPEKKGKRRGWVFARLFRPKGLASIKAPLPAREKRALASEAAEQQSRHALQVAIASAAAAEAAVAAAQAAAEVVLLAGLPHSAHKCVEEKKNHSVDFKTEPLLFRTQREGVMTPRVAAIKIQTSFRRHLAKKALQALKGIVKLQAIIRGTLVRRQTMTTLKCLQSLVNIQSQVSAKRSQMLEGICGYGENKQLKFFKDEMMKINTNGQRRWDDSILTKEEAEAMILYRKEATMKRERIKEYAYNHRKSAESPRNKGNGRWRFWLDQWVDTQLTKSKELEDLDSTWSSDQKLINEFNKQQLKLKTSSPKLHKIEGMISQTTIPRRDFQYRNHTPVEEDNPLSNFQLPTYMAATASAKAKARSLSTPRLRPGSFETVPESYSLYQNSMFVMSSVASSVASEVPSSCRSTNLSSGYQQRSPSLKGISGPAKSSRTGKDSNFGSECSLPSSKIQPTLR